MVADASVNNEPSRMRQTLYQLTIAINCLKQGGTLFLRIEDMFDRFTIDALFLLYSLFQRIGLVKLVASDPSLSDKILVCEGYGNGLDDTEAQSLTHSMIKMFEDFMGGYDQLKRTMKCSILNNEYTKDELFCDWLSDCNIKLALLLSYKN